MTPERRTYHALAKIQDAIGELMKLAIDLEEERSRESAAIKDALKTLVEDLATRRSEK